MPSRAWELADALDGCETTERETSVDNEDQSFLDSIRSSVPSAGRLYVDHAPSIFTRIKTYNSRQSTTNRMCWRILHALPTCTFPNLSTDRLPYNAMGKRPTKNEWTQSATNDVLVFTPHLYASFLHQQRHPWLPTEILTK